MSPCDAAWLAGFWDADGTIGCYKRGSYYVPSTSCSNTDKTIIDHVCQLLDSEGISYYLEYHDRGERSNARPAWAVKMESRPRVLEFISHIEPYLVGKRTQARLLMEWCGLPRARGAKPLSTLQRNPRLTYLPKR